MFKCGGVRELPAANDVIMLKTKATATLYKSSKKRNILSSDPIRTSWKYKKKSRFNNYKFTFTSHVYKFISFSISIQ